MQMKMLAIGNQLSSGDSDKFVLKNSNDIVSDPRGSLSLISNGIMRNVLGAEQTIYSKNTRN
jgi:hypothetical protein